MKYIYIYLLMLNFSLNAQTKISHVINDEFFEAPFVLDTTIDEYVLYCVKNQILKDCFSHDKYLFIQNKESYPPFFYDINFIQYDSILRIKENNNKFYRLKNDINLDLINNLSSDMFYSLSNDEKEFYLDSIFSLKSQLNNILVDSLGFSLYNNTFFKVSNLFYLGKNNYALALSNNEIQNNFLREIIFLLIQVSKNKKHIKRYCIHVEQGL